MAKTWKAVETRIAKRTNGRRVGNTGRECEDVEHSVFSFESKHRANLPAWLLAAYQQACQNASQGKIACVVLHQKNSRRYLALLDLGDLVRLLDV